MKGRLDDATRAFERAIALKPDYFVAHCNLGVALGDKGRTDDAIRAIQRSIALKPDYALAHASLGGALRKLGRFQEALAEFELGHKLGSKDPRWRRPSARWVAESRRLIELDAKLPAIVRGEAKPADEAEHLALAHVAALKRLYDASARLYGEAFLARPAMMEDLGAGHRYNAACAAAMAGRGKAEDVPPPDEAARTRLRAKALEWLRADLAAWAKGLERDPKTATPIVGKTLRHWKTDPDLTGLRDEAELAKLPEAEREAFRALWAEVETLLRKADGNALP